MHAGNTTNNLCMYTNTVQQLIIIMTITTTSWSTEAGPRVRSKRLAKFPAKYRTPAKSR